MKFLWIEVKSLVQRPSSFHCKVRGGPMPILCILYTLKFLCIFMPNREKAEINKNGESWRECFIRNKRTEPSYKIHSIWSMCVLKILSLQKLQKSASYTAWIHFSCQHFTDSYNLRSFRRQFIKQEVRRECLSMLLIHGPPSPVSNLDLSQFFATKFCTERMKINFKFCS